MKHSFTRFYSGSCSDSRGTDTFLRADAVEALPKAERVEVLCFAATYEGLSGCARKTEWNLGRVILMRDNGNVVARYSRADALAADYVGRAFKAFRSVSR